RAGRADARIESGLILLCRLGPTRERAIADMQPVLASLGRGAEAFAQRTLYGAPFDIIEQLDPYIPPRPDQFVLSAVAEPGAWAGQIELIGREIAGYYSRAAKASAPVKELTRAV